jgi:hypothetical protein
MISLRGIDNSLHQRVSSYLRDKPIEYAHEESEEEALDAIFTLLLKAEEDLRTAQERVNLLKWEIEKVKS